MITAPTAYTSYQNSVSISFTITVATPTCDCNLIPWADGTVSSETAGIKATAQLASTVFTLTAPSQATNAYDTAPATRSCTTNQCATTGSFTAAALADGSSLPSWLTFSSGSGTITFTGTDGAIMASNPWVIKVFYVPTEGANNPNYNAISLTVTCEVTSVTVGNNPSDGTYTIFTDSTKIFDLTSVTFTQVPACGYDVRSSQSYSLSTSPSSSFVSVGNYI